MTQELTKLLGKINDKLDNMGKSQNAILTHLKNRCVQERRLDKDLFQYPIDVQLYEIFFKGPTFGSGLRAPSYHCVSFKTLLRSAATPYFFCDKNKFQKIRSLLPTILDKKQLDAFNSHKYSQHLCNPPYWERITCKELGILSKFINIEHYIMDAFVKHHFPKVKTMFFGGSSYIYVLENLYTCENVMNYIKGIYDFMGDCLSELHETMNITYCHTIGDVIDEVLLHIKPRKDDYNIELFVDANELEFKIEYYEKLLEQKDFTPANRWCKNESVTSDTIRWLQYTRNNVFGEIYKHDEKYSDSYEDTEDDDSEISDV